MANHVKTIGTSVTADYDTVSAWEADLDDGTNGNAGGPDSNAAYSSSEDAIGEIIDSAITVANLTIDGGNTASLNSVMLRASSAGRHDGTFGSGCVITNSSSNVSTIRLSGAMNYKFEDLEFDYDYVGTKGLNGGHIYALNTYTGMVEVRRCLFGISVNTHATATVAPYGIGLSYTLWTGGCIIVDNVFRDIYHFDGTSTYIGVGVMVNYIQAAGTIDVSNNTFENCHEGIESLRATGTRTMKNNAVIGSLNADYVTPSNWDTTSNNYCSDSSHGTNTTQSLSELFVDAAGGDYTPKTGSDLIGNGADLVTTPTGVNIDAAQRDRDSNGDTWDVGALQTFSTGPAAAILTNHISNMQGA